MKKKRIVFCILFLILIINFVRAFYSETVFDNWIYPSVITADNKEFVISLSGDETKIGVDLPTGSSVAIDDGSCATRDYYKICFEGKRVGHFDETTEQNVSQIQVEISKILAKLEITKEISDTDFLIGEINNIKVLITNTGSREATNIVFKDSYPKSIKFESVEGCSVKNNTVTWKDRLGVNDVKKCSYIIRVINSTSYSSTAYLTYFDGFDEKSIQSEQVNFQVPNYQLEINSSFNKKNIELGEEIDYTINLTNVNDEYDILITFFEIDIPFGLEVMESSNDLTKSGKKYSWKGSLTTIDPKESFKLVLKASSPGIFNIKEETRFIIKNLARIIKNSYTINISKFNIIPMYNISKVVIESNEKVLLRLDIRNPSKINAFKNIVVTVNSSISGLIKINKTLNELKPGDERNILHRYIEGLNITKIETKTLKIILSYESEDGEVIKQELEKEIKFMPSESIVEETSIETEEENETKSENITTLTDVSKGIKEETETKYKEILDEGKTSIQKFKENIKSVNIFKIAIYGVIFIIIINIIIFILKKGKESEEKIQDIESEPKEKDFDVNEFLK